jgi:hypothetical protein
MERRRAARLAAQYRVQLRSGTTAAVGTVVSISRTGASVEPVEREGLPAVGERLHLHVDPSDPPLDLDARVVSVGEASFAVEFLSEPVELLELLNSLGG